MCSFPCGISRTTSYAESLMGLDRVGKGIMTGIWDWDCRDWDCDCDRDL
jgi:hypothetical protein